MISSRSGEPALEVGWKTLEFSEANEVPKCLGLEVTESSSSHVCGHPCAILARWWVAKSLTWYLNVIRYPLEVQSCDVTITHEACNGPVHQGIGLNLLTGWDTKAPKEVNSASLDYSKLKVKTTFQLLFLLQSLTQFLSFYQNMVLLCSRERIIIKVTTV